MAKRGNGEGTIYKYRNGWRGQIVLGRDPETGKIIRGTASAKTRREVQEKIIALKMEYVKKSHSYAGGYTVDSWLNLWMEKYKKHSIKQKTYESYMEVINNYLVPQFESVQLSELKASEIQAMINSMTEKKLSSRTIRYAVTVLHNALDQAMKNSMITGNVSNAVVLPKQNKRKMRVLSQEEQRRFILACRQDEGGLPFILMLATGIRRAELLGLRWMDLDVEKPSIKIVQSVLRVKDFDSEEPKTKIIFDTPKTESSARGIPIPKSILSDLLAHKDRQEDQKEGLRKLGIEYQDNDLIFASELGTPIEPRNLNRKFYKLIAQAGIENINLHGLRHSFATRLLEEKEHPKVVQELLGHKSIQITLDTYSHVSNDLKKDAIEKINKYF
jgi:integrase